MAETADHRGPSKLTRWWRIAIVGGVDHGEVRRQIVEEAGWSARYAFLIVISAAISLLGLLMPSVAVLIGAMLLSPLMMPIIGLGFGIATLDFQDIRRSATALVAGSVLAVALSIAMVWVSPVQTITSEIAARTQPTLFDLGVALLSALAGGYALIRGRGGTVVGVAIAIALMPPLVVVGFGIATGSWTVFSGALLLFLTNAVTIALTAALVARVHGFGSHLSPAHTWWQLALFFVALGVLSVPLGAALQRIAFDAVAQRQVRDALRAHFGEGARLSQVDLDSSGAAVLVRAVVLTPKADPLADRTLSETLRRGLGRPVDLHIDQLRISADAGEADAAQIAHAADVTKPEGAGDRARAVADFALVAGIAPEAVRVDAAAHRLEGVAGGLPGLGIAGYQALEARAAGALPGWQVALAPPASIELPQIRLDAGVLDDAPLRAAAWASARTGKEILVQGGSLRARMAVAEAIVDRGGQAQAGQERGNLRLEWVPVATEP